MKESVAFLFLGETLLIPHLWPIAEALARRGAAVDAWVATSLHEALLGRWGEDLPVRIRRAPGFRRVGEDARNPQLPPKIPTLLRLLPRLLSARAVVCAEQTSLWLPRLFPLRTPFVKTSHGVGSMSARDDPRRRAAALTLVPSERERATYLLRSFDPARIVATGYVKSGFRQRLHARPPFANARPIVLYAPHWQRHRSSWWATPSWGGGREMAERIAEDGRWNLIFAPHQRLVENAPEVREVMAALAGRPNVHCDLDGFAMVDGSYTAAADIYLGDTSCQVIEFLARPRPCVFLNGRGADWRGDPSYAIWNCGEVVERVDDVPAALARAGEAHAGYAGVQAAFAAESLGNLEGAPERAAEAILHFLSISQREREGPARRSRVRG